jgi:putative Holliday junction resolvase
VDVGDRRVGVAVSDEAGLAARALATFRRGAPGEDAALLARLAREQDAGGLVVGLPLEARGNEGRQARLTRAWGTAMAELTGLPVVWRDERHTSAATEAALGPPRLDRATGQPTRAAIALRRRRVDRGAAVRILQAELDARAGLEG